ETAHARSRCLDQDANASGQSAHRVPQSLLPGGPGLVRESAAKEHLAVLANLPHATGSDGRFGGTDQRGPQTSEAFQSDSGRHHDFRAAAPATFAGRYRHHAHQIAIDAGAGESTVAAE